MFLYLNILIFKCFYYGFLLAISTQLNPDFIQKKFAFFAKLANL
jgi:hypothetical protein